MKVRTCILMLLCALSLVITSSASGSGEAVPPAAELIEELVPEEMAQLLEDRGFPPFSEIISMTPSDFYELVKGHALDSLKAMRGAFFSIIAICLLCGALNCISPSFGDVGMGGAVELVAVLCISVSVTSYIAGCVTQVGAAVRDCTLFMISFTPILTVLLSAYGMPATASLYNLAVLGACQVISQVVSAGLVPISSAYMALCVSAGVSGNSGLWSIASSIKKISNWTLSFMMTLFSGLLALQGFMSSGADNIAVRTTKFLVGNLVPVVGSAISDALMAAQGSVRLIKNAVGTAGIVAALLIFLPVLTYAVLWRVALGFAAACGEIIGVGSISKLLLSFSDVMAVLCAVIVSVGLLVIISTAVMLAMSAG